MNHKPIRLVVGLLLITLALLMTLPVLVNLGSGDPGTGEFLISAVITLILGALLALSGRSEQFQLHPRDAFLLTTYAWIGVCALGALPLLLIEHISYTDAFFETMSGITTTGSTVLSNLEQHPRAVLFWRSLLQWLGGIGFIVMAVALLPFLKIGGMRLFQSESSDWSDKALPRSGSIAKRICLIYVGLTGLCALFYLFGGMTPFEAINHAMTTLSTGGYSTSDQSMAHFTNPAIHWTGTAFMLLGGLPFVLYVKFLRGDRQALVRDTQVRFFIGLMLVVWTGFGLWLFAHSDYSLFQSLTLVAFNTTSVVTTTGFALGDYTLWGSFAVSSFFFLTFIGACSGSTAGGLKIFRLQIALKLLGLQLRQLAHPRAFFCQTYNGQEISTDILRSLIGFSFFYLILIAVLTLALAAIGLDSITALTGAATAVANVGPGMGEIIGPAGNFASLPDTAKWLLCLGMLMGRLEVVTVLVLLSPSFWRN